MDLLGLDIGTSGCKASIIDSKGAKKAQAYHEYGLVSPQPGWQEIDPEEVWSSVRDVIRRCTDFYGGGDIGAICVSSFGEAVIAVDSEGRSLQNSMIYIDNRGKEEAANFEASFGRERALKITGASIHPMYSIFKILWIKKHRPEIYSRTWKYFLFADFILFRLGARPHTDYSLAARTMAFDIVKKEWSNEILDHVGVDRNMFAEPVQSGTIVGEISGLMAAELGIHQGAILAAGGHDQPCAALGAGVINAEIAVDGLGTTECITPSFDRPILSEIMADSGFACVPHVKADMYVTYAFTFTSGSILKWFRDSFGVEYKLLAESLGQNVYDVMIDCAAPGPSDLLLLPHFAGAATPYMDTGSKGMIFGLTIDTKPEQIIKAILEGITFEAMVNLERLREAGIIVNELRAVGGLAKSDRFMQLKADMMGVDVVTLAVSEAGTLGVAMLAGTACGLFASLDDAVLHMMKKNRTFHPDEAARRIYSMKFEAYKSLYPASQMIRRAMDSQGENSTDNC